MNKRKFLKKALTLSAIAIPGISAANSRFEFHQRVSGLSASPAIAEEIYAFSSFTFTHGNVNKTGPTLANLISVYNTETHPWLVNEDFFNCINGIQLWTVPQDGIYRVEAIGARGGVNSTRPAGNGARIQGDFSLKKGEKIRILVGQQGLTGSSCVGGGGGGGSFVVKQESNTIDSILLIAGGGGGSGTAASFGGGVNASIDTQGRNSNAGVVTGGNNGSGGDRPPSSCGQYQWNSGSGGGFLTNGGGPGGVQGNASTGGGFSFINGGQGGDVWVNGHIAGSFGGGGTGGYGGGGGGGFSGGAGGDGPGCSCGMWRGAGGGGSYNNGTNQSNQEGLGTSHGRVTITKIS